MAKIEDLVAQVTDERLRSALAREVRALKKHKKFGLLFEEHLPEMVRLPNLPVSQGELVARRSEQGNALWRVKQIKGKAAELESSVEGDVGAPETLRCELRDLVTVRNFGDPIYPSLVPIDRITRGAPDSPGHVLINADNFHALQLLLYAYERQVDVIYIDPPYNSGARDWKYNNDYVDKTDAFRHSKWLSMIKKRLLLAKRLLSPEGVLIVTIDENEVHRLTLLLESLFPRYTIQQTTIVNNPKGVTQGRFSRVEEFALFVFPESVTPVGRADDYLTPEPDDGFDVAAGSKPRWKGLLRSGAEARREDREKMFYPVLADPKTGALVGVGEPMLDGEPTLGKKRNGHNLVWPVRSNGEWGRWGVGHKTLERLISSGYAALGEYDPKRQTWGITYLSQHHLEQIEGGLLEVVSRDPLTGVADVRYANAAGRRIKTVWKRSRHDAGAYGSSLLTEMLGRTESFSFPKSLYAVEDSILPLVRDKKDALILDFFAGSGTTLHATSLMNWRDGGKRRCILVTNNELSPDAAAKFAERGSYGGDPEYESAGICNAVTWPRVKAALSGVRPDGSHIKGNYLGTDAEGGTKQISSGFEENAEYFRLDFVDPHDVARGEAFKAILPILWLTAGAVGLREDSKGSQACFFPKHSPFAVLIRERELAAFRKKLADRKGVKWVFLVTDSDENFNLMRRSLGRAYCCIQLYKSYLDNFRINMPDVTG